jgi:hypothetical protein
MIPIFVLEIHVSLYPIFWKHTMQRKRWDDAKKEVFPVLVLQ